MDNYKFGVPVLSHLQFAVIQVMHDGISGAEIRSKLSQLKIDGPAFYQLMKRLESKKLVRGWYDKTMVGLQIKRERRYQRTKVGVAASNVSRHFYWPPGAVYAH